MKINIYFFTFLILTCPFIGESQTYFSPNPNPTVDPSSVQKFVSTIPEIKSKAEYYNINRSIMQTIVALQSSLGQNISDGKYNYGRVLSHPDIKKYPKFSETRNGFVLCSKRGRGIDIIGIALNGLRRSKSKKLSEGEWLNLLFGPNADLEKLAVDAEPIYLALTNKNFKEVGFYLPNKKEEITIAKPPISRPKLKPKLKEAKVTPPLNNDIFTEKGAVAIKTEALNKNVKQSDVVASTENIRPILKTDLKREEVEAEQPVLPKENPKLDINPQEDITITTVETPQKKSKSDPPKNIIPVAKAEGLYANMSNWSNDFINGKKKKALKDIKENLKSATPDPLATTAWLTIQQSNNSVENILKTTNEKFKKQVTLVAELDEFYNEGYYQKVYKNFKSKKYSGVTDIYAIGDIVRSIEEIDDKAAYELVDKIFELKPISFQSIWLWTVLVSENDLIRKRLMNEIENGKFKDNPIFESYFSTLFSSAQVENWNEIEALKLFITQQPADAMAFRYLAKELEGQYRYEEAIPYFEKSFQIDPFYGFNLPSKARCLAKLLRFDEAKEICKKAAALYNSADTDLYFYTTWIEVLLDAGDLGRARNELEIALQKHPNRHELSNLYGRLEIASKRYSFGIKHLKEAIKLSPDNVNYAQRLLSAYVNGKELLKGAELINQFRNKNLASESMYAYADDIFPALGETEMGIEILLEGIKQYPSSAYLMRALAIVYNQNNQTGKAIAALEEALVLNPSNSFTVEKYIEWTKKKEEEESNKSIIATKTVEALIEQYPWVGKNWEMLADLKGTTKEKIAVYEKAIDENPGAAFPFQNIRSIIYRTENWQLAEEWLIRAEQEITKDGSHYDLISYYFEAAANILDKALKNKVSPEEVTEGKQYLATYYELGGNPFTYHKYMAQLYQAQNEMVSAGLHYDSLLSFDPDDYNVLFSLNTKFDDDDFSQKRATKLFNRYVNRSPYDGLRLRRAAHLSTKWKSHNINAIRYSQLCKERAPEEYNKGLEADAYGKLGDHNRYYETSYERSGSISNSFRYINWYNYARRNAWKGSTKVEVDIEKNMATIVYPNGSIVRRYDHPEFGVVSRIEMGKAYIAIDYDEEGRLTRIGNSAGEWVKLVYSHKDISKLLTSSGEDLSFKYNTKGKPTDIAMIGIGGISVSYDADGEIDEVVSYGENGEDGGAEIAVKVSKAFQELLGLNEKVRNISSLNSLEVPGLELKDITYDQLRADYDQLSSEVFWGNDGAPSKRVAWQEKGLELATYLVENITNSASYGPEGIEILTTLFEWVAQNTMTRKSNQHALKVAALYYDLLYLIRERGIDNDAWKNWTEMQDWLENAIVEENDKRTRQQMVSFFNKIKTNPIELLESSYWLPRSFLQNKGYWKKFGYADLVPNDLINNLDVNVVFYRKNGEVVVGTNKGISVLRKGYWEWFAYNELTRAFESGLSSSKVKTSSNILSIVEDDDAHLYLGTANGLIKINDDYSGKIVKRWMDSDGLPSLNIEHLGKVGTKILIGTTNGLVWLTEEQLSPATKIKGRGVKFIRRNNLTDYDLVLVGTDEGLFVNYFDQENGQIKTNQILDQSVDDAIFNTSGRIFTLHNNVVYRLESKNEEQGIFQEHISIPLRGNILKTSKIYELANIPINEEKSAVGVLTDQGFSLYHEDHFEYFTLPLADGIAKAISSDKNGNSFTTISNNDIFVFEINQAQVYRGKITNLLTSNELGVTFITDGDDLKYLLHNDPDQEINSLLYFGTTDHLALDANNQLVCNISNEIVRFKFDSSGQYEKEELFGAYPYQEERIFSESSVHDLKVTADGTIWVAAGGSVFRYREGKELQEFNFLQTSKEFPSRTYHIDEIIETIEGDLFVVGSSESHIYYNGISMAGGLLKWNPKEEKFERINSNELNLNWFMNSYTSVGKNLAVIGTNAGFARDKNGRMESFSNLKDPSYLALKKDHPSLFLGTKGVNIGEDIWLFGCASGVVAFNSNTNNWFYPDRLNWILPEDVKYGSSGGRHVNAVETDANGRIYVGTDLGLLIYDGGGADPMSFLINNFNKEEAFIYQNANQVRAEADIVLNALPENSKKGKAIKGIKETEKEINQIEKLMAKDENSFLVLGEQSLQMSSLDTITNKTKLEALRKKHSRMLAQLEREEPGLYQLLEVKPLNLYSMRNKFKEDEVVLQYLPTKKRLFIQVLTKKSVKMAEIIVDEEVLMKKCEEVSDLLTDLAKYDIEYIQDLEPKKNEQLNKSLADLYEILLRPVEKYLGGYENVYVVPAKQLYYVPFAALINKQGKNKEAYAVEDYNIGYITSMSLLNLLMKTRERTSDRFVLMGDPNGDLAGARKEVEKINSLVHTDNYFVGNKATIENLEKKVKDCKYVHLATHGKLNTQKPEESILEFANHKTMTVIDAMELPLDGTEMVVLSACESGVGRAGMEYATLARSFTLAGASSIMASLWQVDDGSTENLMFYLYKNLIDGDNRYLSLAKAQRKMLKSDNEDLSHPSKWAAFVPIGKPAN